MLGEHLHRTDERAPLYSLIICIAATFHRFLFIVSIGITYWHVHTHTHTRTRTHTQTHTHTDINSYSVKKQWMTGIRERASRIIWEMERRHWTLLLTNTQCKLR